MGSSRSGDFSLKLGRAEVNRCPALMKVHQSPPSRSIANTAAVAIMQTVATSDALRSDSSLMVTTPSLISRDQATVALSY